MLSRLFSGAFTQMQALLEQTDECSLVLLPSRSELQEDFTNAFKSHVQESGRKVFARRYSEDAGPENFGAFFSQRPDFSVDQEVRRNLQAFIDASAGDFDQALARVIGLVSVNGIFARRTQLHEQIIAGFCSQADEYEQSVYILYGADLSDTSLFNIVAAITQRIANKNECNFCFVLLYDEALEGHALSAQALKTRIESNGVDVTESRILMPTPMEIVDFLSRAGTRRDAALLMADDVTRYHIAKDRAEYIAGSYIADIEPLEMVLSAVGSHISRDPQEHEPRPALSDDGLIDGLIQCNLALIHRRIASRPYDERNLAPIYLGLNLLYFMETPFLKALRDKAQKATFSPFGLRIATLSASLLASPKHELVKPMAQSLLQEGIPHKLRNDAMFACCLYAGFFADTAIVPEILKRLQGERSASVRGFEDAADVLYALTSAIGWIIKAPGLDHARIADLIAAQWTLVKDSRMMLLKHQLPRLISLFQYSISYGKFLAIEEMDTALDTLADLDFETQSIATSPSSSIMALMYVAARHNHKKQYAKAFGLYRQAKYMSKIFKRSENERAASLRLWEICLRSGFEFEGWQECRYKKDGELKANAPDFQFHACEIKTLYIQGAPSSLLRQETEELFAYLTHIGVQRHAEFIDLWDYIDVRRIEEEGKHLSFPYIAAMFTSLTERPTLIFKVLNAIRVFAASQDMAALLRTLKECCDRGLEQDAFTRSAFLGILNAVRRHIPPGSLDEGVIRLVETWVNDFMSGWTSFEDRSRLLQSRLTFPYFNVADIIMNARKARVMSVMHKTADSIEDERGLCFVIAFGLLIYSRAIRVKLAAHRKERKSCVLDTVAIERDLEHRTIRVVTDAATCEKNHGTGVVSEDGPAGMTVVGYGVAGAFDVSMSFTPSFPKEDAITLLRKAIVDERYAAYLSNQHRKILQIRRLSEATEHFSREKRRFSKNYRALFQLAKEREREVFNKTTDIQSILNNIRVGILSVSDSKTFRVDGDYSQHLLQILGVPTVDDETIHSLLLDHCEIDPYKKSMIGVCLSASLGEHRISFEFNSDLLPRELIYKRQGMAQILELDWNVVLSSDEQIIRKVLLSLRDVTELRDYQEKTRQQHQEIQLIQEIISVTPAKFAIFRTSLEKFCAENARLLDSMALARTEDGRNLRMIYINLHTIKGNAISLGLKSLAALVHSCEERLQTMQKGKDAVDCEILLKDNGSIRELMDTYVKVAKEKLNRADDAGELITLRRSALVKLTDDLLKRSVRHDIGLLVTSAYISAVQLADDVRQDMVRLAKDLEKAPPAFVSQGFAGLYFTYQAHEPLSHALMHLLRNCMDHGIEPPDERVKKGKSEAGRLEINAEANRDALTITLSDDGRGLALNRIRSLAVAKGLVPQDTVLAPEATAELIFSDGFSTASKVTDISGRGVGMGAVREFLLNIGGSLRIEFTGRTDCDFAPFAFVITLPAKCFRLWSEDESKITACVS